MSVFLFSLFFLFLFTICRSSWTDPFPSREERKETIMNNETFSSQLKTMFEYEGNYSKKSLRYGFPLGMLCLTK